VGLTSRHDRGYSARGPFDARWDGRAPAFQLSKRWSRYGTHAAYANEHRPDLRRSQMSARAMRAYILTAPEEGSVQEVPAPVAGPGEVVVDVERVGICGTDVEFFTGEMAYLHSGHASYPMRLGHEWAGTVSAIGGGVEPGWLGRRVVGDTMLGDG